MLGRSALILLLLSEDRILGFYNGLDFSGLRGQAAFLRGESFVIFTRNIRAAMYKSEHGSGYIFCYELLAVF